MRLRRSDEFCVPVEARQCPEWVESRLGCWLVFAGMKQSNAKFIRLSHPAQPVLPCGPASHEKQEGREGDRHNDEDVYWSERDKRHGHGNEHRKHCGSTERDKFRGAVWHMKRVAHFRSKRVDAHRDRMLTRATDCNGWKADIREQFRLSAVLEQSG